MNKNSPWYHFHPDSVGSLHRKHAWGERICRADVERILGANPAAAEDPIVSEHVARAERGELKNKRGPRRSPVRELRMLYAEVLAEHLARRLTARRDRQRSKGMKKIRSSYSATELALVVVGNRLGFRTWETLRNRISLRRSTGNIVSARKLPT